MTLQEFNNEFDILYNSIASNQAPSVSEYEKSVFLTQAQEEIVIATYTGTLNGESFEATEEVRSYIEPLVKTYRSTTKEPADEFLVDDRSVYFIIPEEVWFPIYEQAKLNDERLKCGIGNRIDVKPITHDHFNRIKKNPFKGPTSKRVLRLSLQTKRVELVSDYNVGEYLIRYIRRPQPIIIEDLSGWGLSINGQTNASECELNSAIHRIILKRAVDIAKNSWR